MVDSLELGNYGIITDAPFGKYRRVVIMRQTASCPVCATACSTKGTRKIIGRGWDRSCLRPPPAEIRAGTITALGSCLESSNRNASWAREAGFGDGVVSGDKRENREPFFWLAHQSLRLAQPIQSSLQPDARVLRAMQATDVSWSLARNKLQPRHSSNI